MCVNLWYVHPQSMQLTDEQSNSAEYSTSVEKAGINERPASTIFNPAHTNVRFKWLEDSVTLASPNAIQSSDWQS